MKSSKETVDNVAQLFFLCVSKESRQSTLLEAPAELTRLIERLSALSLLLVLDVGTGLARPLDALDDIDIYRRLFLSLFDVVRTEPCPSLISNQLQQQSGWNTDGQKDLCTSNDIYTSFSLSLYTGQPTI